ncbi:MAG: hypothetical protein AAGH41_03630 [Pseudomonadota bacterium]
MAGLENKAVLDDDTPPLRAGREERVSTPRTPNDTPETGNPLRADPITEPSSRARWLPDPEQVWLAARILGVLVILVWLIAWPIGMTMAASETTGTFTLRFGYSGAVVILALTTAVLIVVGGYCLRAGLRLEATADRLRQAVRSIEPNLRADALREDVNVLGGEIDRALGKLVDAERQIREQVGAIDAATETMREGSGAATDRLAKERRALIDATSAMNAEAEAFATALASSSQKAQADAAALAPDLDQKVERLEKVSSESASQFEALREAMAESLELLRERPAEMASDLKDGADTLRAAQDALIAESEKLRALIDQQKERADLLGRTLAEQSAKLTRRREATKSMGGTWRRILDKVEQEAPAQQPAPVTAKHDAISVSDDERARLQRLHQYTLSARSQLFGAPDEDTIARFRSGDHQIFIRDILSREKMEVKARLALAMDADAAFASEAETFLTDFDALLAPLVDGEPAETEAALNEMLGSPMGKLYVITGRARGHFR